MASNTTSSSKTSQERSGAQTTASVAGGPNSAALNRLYAVFQRDGLRITGALTQAAAVAAEQHQYTDMREYNWLVQELEFSMRELGIGTGIGGGGAPTGIKGAAAGAGRS